MDFNQLRYFLAVSESLNFTRAAEQCHVSQPALTQSIKRLEAELGGELILRDGPNTQLTQLGQSLLLHFRQIDNTRKLVNSTAKAVSSGEQGELNVGLMCTIGPIAITGAIKQFQLEHPMISLILHDVTPTTIKDLLLSGAIDCAFTTESCVANPKVEFTGLYDEAIVVAFADHHPFSELEAVALDAISAEKYVDRLHCEFRSEFMSYCAESNLDLAVAVRSQREDWIQCLIRVGVGVGVLPQYSLLDPELKYRRINDPRMNRRIGFAYIDRTESMPSLEMFAKQIQSFGWSM